MRKFIVILLRWFHLENVLKGVLCSFFMPKCDFSILSIDETLRHIESGGSVVRFGDGEITIMAKTGYDPNFQKGSDKLRNLLTDVWKTRNPNLLVCIPGVISNSESYGELKVESKWLWMNFCRNHLTWLNDNVDKKYLYGDARITRIYIDSLNANLAYQYFERYKKILQGKNLVIVEGKYTRFGCGNDLLQYAKSVRRILAPATNAFKVYEQILHKSLIFKNLCPDVLFIVCLGPTAKPLVKELVAHGIQALDLGHLDVEYEWYLRKSNTRMPIPGKYVNEAKQHYVSGAEDASYQKQVICEIN